jgi:hypothetical protein
MLSLPSLKTIKLQNYDKRSLEISLKVTASLICLNMVQTEGHGSFLRRC